MREEQARGSTRTTALWWLIWIVWIPLFVPNVTAFLARRPAPAQVALCLACTLLFFGLYTWITWRCARFFAASTPRVVPPPDELWAPIVVMLTLAVYLTLAQGPEWGSLFIYMSTATAGWLPLRNAVALIVGITVFTLFGLSLNHVSSAAIASAVAFIAIPGAVVIAAVLSVTASQRLRVAQEEMARRNAVAEERLRIARDLHDLLGHSLSLIALKSELAGRLIPTAPERAAAEIADVQRTARAALHEVREAVAGYRRPTLAAELANAHDVLAAAGIAYASLGDQQATRGLPTAVDGALAWAVREGITNVIRHSRAHTCTISLTREPSAVRLDLLDDGPTIAPAVASSSVPDTNGERVGNGLRGLAERARALGGTCAYGPRPEGGYRLSICLPCSPPDIPDIPDIPDAPAAHLGAPGPTAAVPLVGEEHL